MAKTNVTIGDVANHAGVSKSLVSNYLNGRIDKMTEQTKTKIEEVIKELNYIPNDKYRNYKQKGSGTIGLIIPDITDPFTSLICKGILDAALKHNYTVMMANSDNNIVIENVYLEKFLEQTDGMIIGSVGRNDDRLLELENKLPIVLLDRRMKTSVYDVVSSNNYEAIQDMMEYLVGLEYKAFAMFVEEMVEGMPRSIRYNSYMDFGKNNNMQQDFHVYNVNLYDDKTLMKNIVELMTEVKGKKTAIICANGRTLLHVVSALNILDLKIPDDVGICGYDDFDAAPLLHSGITTISQPSYDIGYRCVEQLVKRITSKGSLIPREINIRSKLVIRGSV